MATSDFDELLGKGGRLVNKLGQTIGPAAAGAVLSVSVYFTGAAGFQRVFKLAGLSSAVPLLAPAAGALGVGLSSMAAGQAAKAAHLTLAGDGMTLQERFAPERLTCVGRALRERATPENLLVDAAIGMVVYKVVLRGKFRSIAPSDVAKPGALAKRYATENQKAQLRGWFRKDGCHTCGKKSGDVIGDHMPPNRVAHGSAAEKRAREAWSWWRRWLFAPRPPKQRFFPQCSDCSLVQSEAVRSGSTALVLHRIQWPAIVGVAAGIRHAIPGPDRWEVPLGRIRETARESWADIAGGGGGRGVGAGAGAGAGGADIGAAFLEARLAALRVEERWVKNDDRMPRGERGRKLRELRGRKAECKAQIRAARRGTADCKV